MNREALGRLRGSESWRPNAANCVRNTTEQRGEEDEEEGEACSKLYLFKNEVMMDRNKQDRDLFSVGRKFRNFDSWIIMQPRSKHK